MTAAEITGLANELRKLIQERTCCVKHAGDVVCTVLGGFALDMAGNKPEEAARIIRREAKLIAWEIRNGNFVMRPEKTH